jgi:hypothetical protein
MFIIPCGDFTFEAEAVFGGIGADAAFVVAI